MPDTYCVLADIGLATQCNGYVSMCNQSRVFWKNPSGQTLTLDSSSLDDAWNSPTRQDIRQSMIDGQQHENCHDCWHEESAGRRSLRQIHNDEFSSVRPLPHQPRMFIIKPGNACNLACRHCNPETSSSWYQDYYKVEGQNYRTLYDLTKQYEGARNSYNDESAIWQKLRGWSDQIIFWDLYGAEPLLIRPLIDLLEDCARSEKAAQQKIHINTNGTIWRDDFPALFDRFRQVNIGISIDGIGDQFEYMRYPARWEHIQSNLEKWKQLNNERIAVDICITASLLNVYYLPEYMRYFFSHGWGVGTNLLHGPAHLNMRIVDQRTKTAIKEKLKHFSLCHDIIGFLDQKIEHDQLHMKKFFSITKSYDQLRNQSYANTFPEFAEILERSHADCWS